MPTTVKTKFAVNDQVWYFGHNNGTPTSAFVSEVRTVTNINGTAVLYNLTETKTPKPSPPRKGTIKLGALPKVKTLASSVHENLLYATKEDLKKVALSKVESQFK